MRFLAHRFRVPALSFVLAILALMFHGAIGAAGQPHEPARKHIDAEMPGDHGATHGAKHGGHKTPTAMEHVSDAHEFHFFTTFGQPWELPTIRLFGYEVPTKYMVLELIAAGLILLLYIPLARRVASGAPASGPFWNAFEVLLTFVRDQIAKPNLGEDIADRYVPFLWTLFLFILFNNLLGMFPFLGSATASIYVTGALALIVFFAIHGSAILAMGSDPHFGHGHHDHEPGHGHGDGHDQVHDHRHGDREHPAAGTANPALVIVLGSWRYLKSLWPQIDLPFPANLAIQLLVFIIEIIGILVRNGVLAVRLFANMFAGHMVLATILLFIAMAANLNPALWGTITVTSVLGIVALSLLELFVAFLQAYIFTFLASLFMGMAITPQH
jgi:F-type H+-transporting ATPase subunit a